MLCGVLLKGNGQNQRLITYEETILHWRRACGCWHRLSRLQGSWEATHTFVSAFEIWAVIRRTSAWCFFSLLLIEGLTQQILSKTWSDDWRWLKIPKFAQIPHDRSFRLLALLVAVCFPTMSRLLSERINGYARLRCIAGMHSWG